MKKLKKPKMLSITRLIPNMITLTALAAGMTAIKFAVVGKWEEAVIAIVIAACMDAFDGAAARLLKAETKLGAELDSLSDFLCFGVAPAILVFLWTTQSAGKFGWAVALVFAMAMALRLARFNIMGDDEELQSSPVAKFFTGTPAPMGAGLAMLPMVVSFQLDETTTQLFVDCAQSPVVVGGWMLVVAAMMVSNIPTFSSKQIKIPQKFAVMTLGLFVLLLAGIINETWETYTLLCVIYLFSIPFSVRDYNKKIAGAED